MNDALNAAARKERTLRLLGCAVLIFSPFLLLLILSLALRQNALQAYPVWLDELCYWRTLLSWDAQGFHTGYYGMFEEAAAIGTLGTSGIGPILLYGWFVKLFGLTGNTILLANAVWISLAALVFCLVRRPRPAVTFMLSALLMTYAPMILYCLTSMTECFNYALVLLYVAFLLQYQEQRTPWALALCCLTVVFGCLYRPMYAVLFLPVILFYSRSQFGWRMLGASLLALALTAACSYLCQLSAAPNAQGFVYHLLRAPDPGTMIRMVLSRSKANLTDFFLRPTQSPMQDAFRWMYCVTTLLCLAGSFLSLERRGLRVRRVHVRFRPPFFSCFLLLTAAFGLTMMLYEATDWRDYRRLAPFLWLTLAFLTARWRFTIPALSLAAFAATLALLFTLGPVGALGDETRFVTPAQDPAAEAIAQAVVFDESAEDPFANTIRTDISSYRLMESLHPGLGLQYGWFTPETTGRSRWILTDQLKCAVTGYESVLDLGDYKLYRHIDATEASHDPN